MTYPGGKAGAGVYQTIINQMPPHAVYIEPFAGHGGVLRHKRPAAQNIAIDADSDVAAFWSDFPDVTFINMCGVQYLETRAWRGDELVYCDPPYLRHTRRSRKRLYKHEMPDELHSRFLAVLQRLPCAVMVSGYASLVYQAELADWHCVTFQAPTRGGPATEYLWCNFDPPAALHDYSHLGGDYRERERIKRKADRWARRFADLPELERQAVLSRLLAPSQAAIRPGATAEAAMQESGTGEDGGEVL